MIEHREAVDRAAAIYPDWSGDAPVDLVKRRSTLARLLTSPKSFDGAAAAAGVALSHRYDVLLEGLAEVGCFFLRAGAIENYFCTTPDGNSKPNLAAAEAASFADIAQSELTARYDDALAALHFIAPDQRVDEDLVLRPKLSAVISAAFQSMTSDTADAELNRIAQTTIGADAEVFRLENRSNDGQLRLSVSIGSLLFQRPTFPFEIGAADNVNSVVPRVLPGSPS